MYSIYEDLHPAGVNFALFLSCLGDVHLAKMKFTYDVCVCVKFRFSGC